METSLACLNCVGNVDRGNCAPTVEFEVNVGDVVPTGCLTSGGIKRRFKRDLFRGAHPQRIGLEGRDQ